MNFVLKTLSNFKLFKFTLKTLSLLVLTLKRHSDFMFESLIFRFIVLLLDGPNVKTVQIPEDFPLSNRT